MTSSPAFRTSTSSRSSLQLLACLGVLASVALAGCDAADLHDVVDGVHKPAPDPKPVPPPDQDPCAVVRCKAGTQCVVLESYPPQARCVEVPTPPPSGSDCKTDEDCSLVANYCGSCSCDALPRGKNGGVTCSDPVQCLRDPCSGDRAVCQAGTCVAAGVVATSPAPTTAPPTK